MTIKEVCEKYNITQDTLRYYEKSGMIPLYPTKLIAIKKPRKRESLYGMRRMQKKET